MGDQDSTSDERIVIIGAGECGTRAAMALRESGSRAQVTLIGREDVHAYERPPLSKASLVDDDPDLVHPWTPEQLAEAGISLRLGVEATAIDPRTRTVMTTDGPVGYDRLLLAMGADARHLGLGPVHYVRTHQDAAALRAAVRRGGRMLVIGAGFIGLEIAAGARERGMEVTVVEVADRALSRIVPEVVAQRVVDLHAQHGVTIRTGTTVAAITQADDAARVVLSDGDELVVDVVVAGVGANPATELATAAGLLVEDGVLVDEQLRTSDPHIWAAGDCAAFPDPRSGRRVRVESWRNAHDQAVTAVASMLGGGQPHTAVAWFWSDQYDQMLQSVGLPGAGASEVVRTREDGSLIHFELDAHGRLVAATSLGRGPVVARDIRAAEQLIAAGADPEPAALADPGVPLRSLR